MSPQKPTKKNAKSADLTTLVSDALAAVKRIASVIPLDDVSPEDALAAQRAANRVPVEATSIAIDVLEANPKRFVDFSADAVRSAVQYDQVLSPLATQVTLLAQRITKSVQKRRGDSATQTLALYQILKGLSRLTKTEAIRSQQRDMAKLFTTAHRSRATSVTKVETHAAVSGIKATKVAAVKAAKAAAAAQEANEAADAAGIAAPVSPTVSAPAAATTATPVVTTGPATVVASH